MLKAVVVRALQAISRLRRGRRPGAHAFAWMAAAALTALFHAPLQAAHGTGGKSRVEIPIEFQGPPISIAFNPQYLLDMLKQLAADAPLEVDLIDGNHPALFRLGDGFQYLVMPLS